MTCKRNREEENPRTTKHDVLVYILMNIAAIIFLIMLYYALTGPFRIV